MPRTFPANTPSPISIMATEIPSSTLAIDARSTRVARMVAVVRVSMPTSTNVVLAEAISRSRGGSGEPHPLRGA